MRRRACRKCGSRNYGSAVLDSGVLTRHCHGHMLLPGGGSMTCKYRWPQTMDYEHFEREDGRGFASAAEYQLAWDQWIASVAPEAD